MLPRSGKFGSLSSNVPAFGLLVVSGCSDLLNIGDLSSKAHAGAQSSESTSGQGGIGGQSRNWSSTVASGIGGKSALTASAPSAGAAQTNSAFAGSHTRGTAVPVGSSTGGTAGMGGTATSGGGSTLGGSMGTAESGGRATSGGDSARGGRVDAAGSGGTATSGGDSARGGSLGTSQGAAGGSSTSTGSVTVYDLTEFLLQAGNDMPSCCWQLSSAQRVPSDRARTFQSLTPIARLDAHHSIAEYEYWDADQDYPIVAVNTSDAPYRSAFTIVPPRSAVAHPGEFGEYADILWTAPASGRVDIDVNFLGIDKGESVAGGTGVSGTTTDVHVLVRGQPVWSGTIDGCLDRANARISAIPVKLDDIIEFDVGVGGDDDYHYDGTEIDAVITLTSPE